MIKLGVNIDHVATLRQARKEGFPDPVQAALAAVEGGADGITAHLREDRRHIQDDDIIRLKRELAVPLNMEMACAPDIVAVAEKVKPAWACLVPEKREEVTTEGGLDVAAQRPAVERAILRLHKKGVRVSLFVEPSPEVLRLAKELGADAVELHTGTFGRATKKGFGAEAKGELERLVRAADQARSHGLAVNAGHGLTYENVGALARAFPFNEFNIGFSIIARSVFIGIKPAVADMKARINESVCAES